MVLLLSGLEFLAFIDLLYLEFLLLLLVFLVLFSVACVWSSDMFGRGQILSVNSGTRTSGFCGWARSLGSRTSSFSGWASGFCVWTRSLGVRASIAVRRSSRSRVD